MSCYLNVNAVIVTNQPIEHKIRTATPMEMMTLCNLLMKNHDLLREAADFIYANVNVPMGGEGTLYVRHEYPQDGTSKCIMEGGMRSCDNSDIPGVLDCMTRLFDELKHDIIISAVAQFEMSMDDGEGKWVFNWDVKERGWVEVDVSQNEDEPDK
jgi:hypothetical protein